MESPAVLTVLSDGPPIATERDASDLLGEAMSVGATLVALPVSRLTADFFTLRTGLAGAIVQKFVNYRIALAIIGDISAPIAASEPFRDFVRESNRGHHLWFVTDMPALEDSLTGRRARGS